MSHESKPTRLSTEDTVNSSPNPGPDDRLEVVTMGRVGVDIYPEQIGVGLDQVDTFRKFLGGSPTNVAVAAARHGRSSAVVTRTGEDTFGRFVRQALRGYGVDDRFVSAVPGVATPVTFCEIFPPDDFPLYFYGRDPAPDLLVQADELDLAAVAGADLFWATVTGLCREPSRSATLEALRARQRRGHTVLDLDYRPMFWDSREEASRWAAEALSMATTACGNLDEWETAVGTRDPEEAARRGREAGLSLAVVKQGPEGVLAVDDSGSHRVPPLTVDVVNGLGAGDAFGGALCHGLLSGWHVERTTRFANAAGALVASRLSCSEAMPATEEVWESLGEVAHAG
ncbi:5-dehydro-2-deoxygluconokinase [Nocardiopsis salina]|uniref:5-dehydro-2-deoxygluconokinase n=1 Tax=Nocardiopsis salina TaxID=245836 RepID=UPI000346A20E|nr:5-dehydro-2-deoxygluconokinase [Nocardiopsis salina]